MATAQLRLAGKEPARGWPACPALYPEDAPAEVIHDPVRNAEKRWHLAADFGWVADAAMGPLTPASKAAKAVLVDPGEFRTLGGNAQLLRPLVVRGFRVGELKDCVASRRAHLGVRLGPKISALYT